MNNILLLEGGMTFEVSQTILFLWIHSLTLVSTNETGRISTVGVEGASSRLPCPLNPLTKNDEPKLILWYRRGSRTPIFTYNGRDGEAVRGSDNQLSVSHGVATLALSNLRSSDAGIYECRVDFFRSPTHTSIIKLEVVSPVRSLEVFVNGGERPLRFFKVGPFKENSKLTITCLAKGGSPSPNVTWWSGGNVIDSGCEVSDPLLVRNDLVIPRLTPKWADANLSCVAQNGPLVPPKSISLQISLFLMPAEVQISSPAPLHEGDIAKVSCSAVGSRPAAAISWIIRGQEVAGVSQIIPREAKTLSTYTLIANRSDNGHDVICRARNLKIPGSIRSNSTKLHVRYPPVAVAELGPSIKPGLLKEGDDVYFICNTSANPPVSKIAWYHKDVLQVHDASEGIILSGSSLVLQGIKRRRAGNYKCRGTNILGSATSPPVMLRIKYIPECRTSPTTYFIYDTPINLTCTVVAYPPVTEMLWKWNSTSQFVHQQILIGSESLSEEPRKGNFEATSVQLPVFPDEERKERELSCWGINEMGMQLRPCTFSIHTAQMPAPLSSCRLANITDSSLSLSCKRPDEPVKGTTLYRAEVYLHNRTLLANVTSLDPFFNVSRLDAGTNYQIKVYVSYGPVTSQPVLVSAYTSRNPESVHEELAFASLKVTLALLALLLFCSSVLLCLLKVLLGSSSCAQSKAPPLQPAAGLHDDSNPDVVPNIEETYDFMSTLPRATQEPLHSECWIKDDSKKDTGPVSRGSYLPLLLRRPLSKEAILLRSSSSVKGDLYCPVDQLLYAEESVV